MTFTVKYAQLGSHKNTPIVQRNNAAMKRREFIQQSAIVAAATVTMDFTAEAKVNWPIGCFNRPWTKWSFDETLKQIKAAGYKSTGLLSRTREEPFIGADATPEYLENLKKRIAANGLAANMGALRSRHNIPLEDSIREVRKQIDNAKFLSLKYVLSFGADNPEEFAHYYKVMSDASAYAEEKGVKLAMKPHGGISGSAEEILRVRLRRNERRRDDPVRRGQSGFRRRLQEAESRRIQRAGDGRVLQGGRDAGRDNGECARQPRIPGEGSCLGLTPPTLCSLSTATTRKSSAPRTVPRFAR